MDAFSWFGMGSDTRRILVIAILKEGESPDLKTQEILEKVNSIVNVNVVVDGDEHLDFGKDRKTDHIRRVYGFDHTDDLHLQDTEDASLYLDLDSHILSTLAIKGI